MAWTVRLASEADKQLKKLPRDRRELIHKHLLEMAEDPLRGDVKPLKGPQWKGRYRKRVGSYRIIFVTSQEGGTVDVSAILPRSEKTYR